MLYREPPSRFGYLNREQETRDAFIDGALHKGDVGHLDANGYLVVTDRIKDLIICSSYNVYSRMIEDALYEHPAVAEAIALGVPDPYRGPANIAFVTLHADEARTGEELRAFLGDKLSPIELPARIEIKVSLPKTAVGKLSRKELIEEAIASSFV